MGRGARREWVEGEEGVGRGVRREWVEGREWSG